MYAFWINKQKNTIFLTCGIIFLFIVLPINDWLSGQVKPQEPLNSAAKSLLEKELEKLPSISGTTVISKNYFIRNGSGFAAFVYEAEEDMLYVLSYYDEQFKKNGWRYDSTREVINPYIDSKNISIFYQKDENRGKPNYAIFMYDVGNKEFGKHQKNRFTVEISFRNPK